MKGAGAKGKPKPNKSRVSSKATGKLKSKADRAGGLDDLDVGDAEKRMEQVVRAQGRLTKKGGKMVSSGTGDFQIAGGDALERLVNGR